MVKLSTESHRIHHQWAEAAKARKKRARLHRIWLFMKQRCLDPSHPSYHRYGGRGITICSEWMNEDNFARDMWDSYKPGLTIDRIDNDSGYSRDNCQWLTRSANSKKRSASWHQHYKELDSLFGF